MDQTSRGRREAAFLDGGVERHHGPHCVGIAQCHIGDTRLHETSPSFGLKSPDTGHIRPVPFVMSMTHHGQGM
jgi:hypothetical protein